MADLSANVSRKLRQAGVALAIIAILFLIGTIAMTRNLIGYYSSAFQQKILVKGSIQQGNLPSVERNHSPTAVLVLDVSGSMQKSDEQHLQTEAVERFYDYEKVWTRENQEIRKSLLAKVREA